MPTDSPPLWTVCWKTAVVHTVTYFLCGAVAYFALGYERAFSEVPLSHVMRPTSDALVRAGVLFQPLRGVLFGVVFWLLRCAWVSNPRGWLVLWLMLVVLGIVSTFAAPPGSIEGLIYTRYPIRVHIFGLPEIVAQAGMLALLMWQWVNAASQRWLTIAWLVAFAIVIGLPILGMAAGTLARG